MKTNLKKSEEAEKTKAGLPEIADEFRKKKPLVIAIIVVISIATLSMFFAGKHNKKMPQPVEETYSVQSNLSELKPQLPTPQSQASNNQVEQAKLAMAQEQLEMIKQKQNELQ